MRMCTINDAIVIDGHNDVGTWILDFGFDLGMDGSDPKKHNAVLYWVLGRLLPRPSGDKLRTHTDLNRLRRGGVNAQFFSGGLSGRAHSMIEALYSQIESHSSNLELAVCANDIRRIAGKGKIAVLFGLEGGHTIEDDLDNLREFYRRGVRYMTLTWNNTNGWADSSNDKRKHGGLTSFGRQVVLEMNRLGMIVDVSHSSDETFWDVLEVTQAPIMASHSSVRVLVDNPRNLSDDMLQAITGNRGIVMINFGGPFIDSRKATKWKVIRDVITHLGPSSVPLSLLLDHIDHAVAVAGIDHVGLGSDFDGTAFLPDGVKDVSGFPNVTAGLVKRGYSVTDIRKILGENVLRVLEQVEAVAQ
jgi:membrane dipeptidase